MRTFTAVVVAILAATLVPVALFGLYWTFVEGESGVRLLPLALVVASLICLGHVLILGVPAAAWLLRRRRFTVPQMMALGAIVGSLPFAIWAQPYKYVGTLSSSYSNGEWKLINGMPTAAGWIDYAQFVGVVAVLGACGGAAFCLAYRSISANNSSKPTPLRGAA